METIELSGRTGQEVYEELKYRLEGMGYLPDEYFLPGVDWEDRRVIPRNADLFCTTNYGDNKGIYLDVYLKWYGEGGKPMIKSFATGKTLGESGPDMDRTFLIFSATTKTFHGEQGAYARHRQTKDSTKAEGVMLHPSPEEQRILMNALLEQRMRQETQVANTEQSLHRTTGNITAYTDGAGARPLHMSTANRAMLVIRDGELYAFSSLTVQIIKPEERDSLLVAAAGRPGPVGKRMARLVLEAKSPYPEDVWLDVCKRVVDTGDPQRVQMMLDQIMDKVVNSSPVLSSEVFWYAFGRNHTMARELIRQVTSERVAAVPSRLLCGAAHAHDLPTLTELPRKGLQPGDQAAPLLRPLFAAYDEQRAAHLLRDSLRVQSEDYEAVNVRLRAQAQAAVEAPLEWGTKLDGYLAWTAKQDVPLGTQVQGILDCLAEQQAQVNSVPEQNGPVLGGTSL